MIWRENTRDKTEMVWTPTEEICWEYWEKGADDGTDRKEEMRMA